VPSHLNWSLTILRIFSDINQLVQGDTKTETFEKLSAQLQNYHCFCKTILWGKYAVDPSTDP
jgi:hypothetical protein